MRKKTLAGLCGLLSLAIVIVWNFLIFKIPFGLAPLFAFFVLVPVLMAPLTLINKRLLAWRKTRGRDIQDEERYEHEETGIISLRPRD